MIFWPILYTGHRYSKKLCLRRCKKIHYENLEGTLWMLGGYLNCQVRIGGSNFNSHLFVSLFVALVCMHLLVLFVVLIIVCLSIGPICHFALLLSIGFVCGFGSTLYIGFICDLGSCLFLFILFMALVHIHLLVLFMAWHVHILFVTFLLNCFF